LFGLTLYLHNSITAVNQEMEDLGWGIEIVDNVMYEKYLLLSD
jgi:hypothetical protein